MNPLDRPTLCPFCLRMTALSAHVGVCPAVTDENPQPAELPQVIGEQPTMQEQISAMLQRPEAELLDETVRAWSAMFQAKLGRAPTQTETDAVRSLAQQNLRRLKGQS